MASGGKDRVRASTEREVMTHDAEVNFLSTLSDVGRRGATQDYSVR